MSPPDISTIRPGTNTSFGALKQVDAGVLNVGYAEAGPAGGPAVILLHGWPYDIHSFADVTPALASGGYRVIVPFVRGYGTTRFLSGDTPRNGQQAALAADVIAHMDALGIDKAILAGFDWGARSANVIAALARALQGPGLRERVPDRQPGRQRGAAATAGRVSLVVPVLLRHRARPGPLRQVPARFQQVHLAACLTEMGL
jgi:pimeloyl-ACP methyl ester carboxylesterase